MQMILHGHPQANIYCKKLKNKLQKIWQKETLKLMTLKQKNFQYLEMEMMIGQNVNM